MKKGRDNGGKEGLRKETRTDCREKEGQSRDFRREWGERRVSGGGNRDHRKGQRKIRDHEKEWMERRDHRKKGPRKSRVNEIRRKKNKT